MYIPIRREKYFNRFSYPADIFVQETLPGIKLMDRETDYSGDIIANGFYCLPVCGGLGLEGLEGRIGVSTAGWMDR